MKKAMQMNWIITIGFTFLSILTDFDYRIYPYMIIFGTIAIFCTVCRIIKKVKRKDKKATARKLNLIRISRNLTIEQVADITQIRKERIQDFETNEKDPTPEEKYLLEKCYNISI